MIRDQITWLTSRMLTAFVSIGCFPLDFSTAAALVPRFAAAGPQQARALVGPVRSSQVPRLLRCFAAVVFQSAR
jgi:hypothetical protein